MQADDVRAWQDIFRASKQACIANACPNIQPRSAPVTEHAVKRGNPVESEMISPKAPVRQGTEHSSVLFGRVMQSCPPITVNLIVHILDDAGYRGVDNFEKSLGFEASIHESPFSNK